MRLRRALRENGPASVALVGIVLLAAVVGGYILAHQRLNPPAWIPVIGEEHFELRAELDSAQGILPGQGQAVNVSGVKVGDIASVDLEDGKAVATLNIEPRFARVYPDATLLLRPKTGVKDMVLELDPGSPTSGPKLEEGALVRNDATQPDVNLSEFLESLDGDTQAFLTLLVQGGGEALGDGGGEDLASVFRRFPPLSRDVARASRLVAQRRQKLRRVMGNFSKLMVELGDNDRELARFVSSSSEVFERFANQNDNVATTLELLPGALTASNRALARVDRLGRTLEGSLGELRPTARALGPTLEKLQPFFRRTAVPIRDQIRPFTREARPTARTLAPAARDLAVATPELRKLTGVLNALFDELAYDPPGKGIGREGFLFFAPWAAHNSNSVLAAQDGLGPIRRSVVLMTCGGMDIVEGQRKSATPSNPMLIAMLDLLNTPSFTENCAAGSGG